VSVDIDFDDVRDDLDSHRFIGAVEGDNVVGIISVGGTDGYPDLDPKGAIISDLYVSPYRRNSNIGTELVEEAVRCARREYGNKIYADILDDGLLYFYKRLGFKENGEGQLLLDYSPKQKDREDI
jgi:ribosomal protein S18 acetylase RimI-like enzyme